MAKPVISLIGAGRLGTSLLAALAEKGFTAHGVADRDLKLAQQTARTYLQRFPEGNQAELARSVVQSPAE